MPIEELRFAFRMLRSRPLGTGVAVLSLALGIGANTAVFTIADQVLFRMLPVRAPEQLVSVRGGNIDSYPAYREFRDRNSVFDGLAAISPVRKMAIRAGAAESEVAKVRLVSGNFFGTLGAGASLGRTIQESDDRAPGESPVAAISYGLWTRRFGRNPAVLGSRISINGHPFQIVGVIEPGFHGIEAGQESDLYIPIHMLGQVFPTFANVWRTGGWHWLWTMGRLKPGVTMAQARADLNALAPHVAQVTARPGQKPEWSPVEVFPGARGNYLSARDLENPAVLLMCATGFVLLIACANVANLWLAAASRRRREIAIREAVGASQWQLMRQLLTESALVAALGGAAGLLLAFWLTDALAATIGASRGSFRATSPLDGRVLGFTAGISLISAVLFGLAPAWRASRSRIAEAMRPAGVSTADGRKFTPSLLVGLQVALSVILLVGAGLFARTLSNLRQVDTGFERDRVLLVDVQPGEMGYSGERLRRYYDNLVKRARSHPGVVAASLSGLTPLSGAFRTSTLTGEGFQHPPGERPQYYVNPVSAGYFATMGIPMLSGRDFGAEDEPAVAAAGSFMGPGITVRGLSTRQSGDLPRPRAVAIINESLARKFFGTANAVGRRISYGGRFWADSAFEIVGVVKDVRYAGLRERATDIMYTPGWREGAEWRALAVRTSGDPKRLISAIRSDARELDAAVPIQETATLDEQLNSTIAAQRVMAYLSSGFGLLAAALAAVGLYGVLAQGVARRTKEIGIRMALGADRRAVLAMVLRESFILAVFGITAGLAGSAALTRLITHSLYGVKPTDPAVCAAAGLFLLAVSVAAAWFPARRAASVDPLNALRYE